MKRNLTIGIIFLITGIFIGWLIFHHSPKTDRKSDQPGEKVEDTVWTCSMHPQIRMAKPGKCPICGMDLIPLLKGNSSAIDPNAVQLSKESVQLANIVTSTAKKQIPVKELRLYGKVQADERRLQSQVAHIPGRIEKLAVNFTGESVVKGQLLAEIYSPELIAAQQELLETVKTKLSQPELYQASREKLHNLKLTDSQIDSIETAGVVKNHFKVVSNTSGTVTSRLVKTGDYVSQGTPLFEISDLSRVWIVFDAYENDLQFLNKGQKVSFTLQSFPGTVYEGDIDFIDPEIDPVNRVAKVRVEADNRSGKFKPEMFATGIISSTLIQYTNNIVVPKSAVLWTGKRSVVYVRQPGTDEFIFKIRKVDLGPMLGESYVILNGLTVGEEIVTNGTFSVDAEAQLEGKSSMMNKIGNKPSGMQGMKMSEDSLTKK